MPDPKFTQPWHGVPRDQIDWHPIIDDALCNGCGVCVTGCGRSVFAYEYEREKAVVGEPLHCMVGCVTCANVCPEGAVSFPSLDALRELIQERGVVPTARRELEEGRARLGIRRPEPSSAGNHIAEGGQP